MEQKFKDLLKNIKEHPLSFLRENLSIIIIIPTTIGGLWQLFQLASLDISFIRFFSITQLIADGLLILFTFSILFIIYLTYSFFLFNFIEKIDKSQIKEQGVLLVYLVFIVFITLINYRFSLLNIIEENNSKSLFSLIIIYAMVLLLLFEILKYLFHFRKIKKYFFALSVNVLIILYVSFTFIFDINKSCLLPENLLNLEIIKKNISKHNPKTKVDLLYFNDNYIFFSFQYLKKEKNVYRYNIKYLIIPIEDLKLKEQKFIDNSDLPFEL